MNKQAFYNLRIQSIEKETEVSSKIRFALPETLVDEFNFKPGQYISIKFEMKKKAHVRTYSISSEPDRNFIEIGVKHIKNGIFSKFLKTKNKLLVEYYGELDTNYGVASFLGLRENFFKDYNNFNTHCFF